MRLLKLVLYLTASLCFIGLWVCAVIALLPWGWWIATHWNPNEFWNLTSFLTHFILYVVLGAIPMTYCVGVAGWTITSIREKRRIKSRKLFSVPQEKP